MLFPKLQGQVIIKGEILNAENKPLSRINVLVYATKGKGIIAFAISDERGRFQTSVSSSSDSIYIEASSINYKKEIRKIPNKSQTLHFKLATDIKQLETIIINAPPIEKHGDTLSYLVSSFTKKQDRSIEDVLRHMPGIDVEPNGQILYQGVPIQKFYVEGLDLMNGRYSVISKNLPGASVSTVEILEDHQPIRILEDRVPSYQASLNLKLKHGVTATGTAKLGAGLKPVLWDVNITPMFFTKKFQLLASYQTNNTGNNITQQTRVLTYQDIVNRINRPEEYPAILNIVNANAPDIAVNRYLNNNAHLLNFNGLTRLNNDFQFRFNLYYINDKQQQEASVKHTLFSPSDTISFTEYLNNISHDNFLYGNFSLNRNVKDNYLNNDLKIKIAWDKQTGYIRKDDEKIYQTLNEPLQSISNELRTVNIVGKHLVEFRSYINYDIQNHSLEIEPGQFQQLLNNGHAYDKTFQNINLKRFFTENSASLIYSLKKISFTPKAGFSYRGQMLESKLFVINNGEETEAGENFTNKIDGRHYRIYFQTGILYQRSKLSVKSVLHLSWQVVNLNDLISGYSQNVNRLFFDPSLSFTYKFKGFWRIRGLWSYNNRLDDIDAVYDGFILRNYRNLTQNAAPLAITSLQNFSVYFSYRNPISSFFNSFGYVYTIRYNNVIYNNLVQSDGTSVLQAYPMNNIVYSHNFHGQFSKFFSHIKTTFRVKANVSYFQGKSLLNKELFTTRTLFYNIKPGISIRFTKWLNTDYIFDADYIETFIEKEKKSKLSLLKHVLDIFVFPAKNQMFSLRSEYYLHENENNLFVDLMYRFTITKRNLDIELRWNNVFNGKRYIIYQANAFNVLESNYLIRPSQLLLSVKFGF